MSIYDFYIEINIANALNNDKHEEVLLFARIIQVFNMKPHIHVCIYMERERERERARERERKRLW